jgi:YHS domain-containing protein
MSTAHSGDDSRIVKDPICGKDVDTLRARAVGIFGGVTYYFCSFECKAKFKDPRQAPPSAPPPKETGERRGREPAELPPPAASSLPSPSEQVRYAHSRMRRITGEVASPVVQIELSPGKKPTSAESGVREAAPVDEPPPVARSARAWTLVAILMLLIAGGVIFFTLKHQ